MPSAFRNPKNLAEWLELDFFRRPRSLSRWKSMLIWLTFVALLGWSGGGVFHSRVHALASGPVSAAHTFIGNDCTQCHTEPLQTPKRFVRWDNNVRAVSNEACSKCHEGPPHNDQQLVDSIVPRAIASTAAGKCWPACRKATASSAMPTSRPTMPPVNDAASGT